MKTTIYYYLSIVRGTVLRAEDAMLRLSLPLPLVYSQLYGGSSIP